MLIGYARTSTTDQRAGFESQIKELKAAGADKVFSEQVSSVARRDQLEAALDFARDGDVLVVTKLDRLARSMANLIEIEARLKAKGVGLRILAMALDTGTPTGQLMLRVLGSVAEFERAVMLERQREGIAKAKAEGKYAGRQPTARRKADKVLALHATGKGATEIAEETGIGRSSVYRILRSAETSAA